MKITLFGAVGGEVTGSAYQVESGKAKVLIDGGLFHSVPDADRKNRIPQHTFRHLDSVLITHAHLDHTGRLPILAQRRFTGSLFAQKPRLSWPELILRDAARQAGDTLHLNRRRARGQAAAGLSLFPAGRGGHCRPVPQRTTSPSTSHPASKRDGFMPAPAGMGQHFS